MNPNLQADEARTGLGLAQALTRAHLSLPRECELIQKLQSDKTTSASLPAADEDLSSLQAKMNQLKEELVKMKKEGTSTKADIAKKAEDLETIKFKLPEALGGFNDKDRESYKKKLAKLERSQKFQAAQAQPKEKEKKKKEGAPEAEKPPPPQTFTGKKKDTSGKLFSAYHPQNVEAVWDAWWDSKQFFHPSSEDTGKPKFVMVIPPPNVTGSLHIGHALTCSIEDALTRWHRMLGHQTLWLPGTDHAGIATQSVVEKQLLKEWELDNTKPRRRQDMGREKFVERVWEFRNAKGNTILSQLRRLGASVDHSRTVFTLDEQNNRAVVEAFVRLFEQGKIYRATRLVHWSYSLKTAISSIEVDDLELVHDGDEKNNVRKVPGHANEYKFGFFHNFAYPIHPEDWKEGMPKEIVVATTRLETMLGDVAVAVHPDDDRYKSIHGVRLLHPYHPDRQQFTVVCDSFVDIQLGTGAVKITPAHDENDFQAARRLGIDSSRFMSIFNDDGGVTPEAAGNAAELANMMRYDARIFIKEDLERKGLFRGEVPNPGQILPICSRSGDVVEPRLIPQWWVDCKEMADRSVEAVRSKELKLIPSNHEAVWYEWLTKVQPWCVSRQLWWGHRIPAWRLASDTSDEAQWFVARNENDARVKAAQALGLDDVSQVPPLVQDEDVLDTWFSSGLFPFASFGWPDESSPDLKTFFPGHLLETGNDILFFWVARMVMMSLALTDQLPFKTVYLHAMVRDKQGRKMSKTLGNVIDPVDVMEGRSLDYLLQGLRLGNLALKEVKTAENGMKENFKNGLPECGADALRFGLLDYTKQGREINLDVEKIHTFRKFCNKIWNICRFCQGLIDEVFPNNADFKADPSSKATSRRDKWILHRLLVCIRECNEGMENFAFAKVTTALYQFWYDHLADVYVESCKLLFRKDARVAREEQIKCLNTLYTCLDTALRLTHPVMPFMTEELWQHLPGHAETVAESLCIAEYPTVDMPRFKELENHLVDQEMTLVKDASQKVRNMIKLVRENAKTSSEMRVMVVVNNPEMFDEEALTDLGTFCNLPTRPESISESDFQADGCMVDPLRAGVKIAIKCDGISQVWENLAAKQQKKLQELEKQLKVVQERFTNEAYLKKVQGKPAQLEEDKKREEELLKTIDSLKKELGRA